MKWILACHIIAVVCWFAGLFYLPRLFVYHADARDQISLDRFVIMERRLFFYIMQPSACITAITGIALLHFNGISYLHDNWMHAKLFFVGLLYLFHLSCWHHVNQFTQAKNKKPSRYFRFYNEFPSLILILVVFLVVLQPQW